MRTRAIIHLDRFLRNFHAVKARIGQRHICVPVKANAYGHGMIEIARSSMEAGAFCLGVTAAEEGFELRGEGITAPILLFSQPHPDEIPEILEMELIPFISDKEFACALNKQAEIKRIKLPVHIKIDTGMGRIGCLADEALPLARYITTCSGLELAGIATHFAAADSTHEQDIIYTQEQLTRFKKAITQIKDAGINPGIIHAANSGAVILHPDTWFDMIRPGILLYGYKTAEESAAPPDHIQKLSDFEPIKTQPVMELKTTVALIKKIKKGESVSYQRIWTAPQDTFIGILPVGYADGLPRLVSNKWQVIIGGNTYPLVGRITMDQCYVDLGTEQKVSRWEEVTIFGCPGKDAADLACIADTIPYEITCNIGKRVPRLYTSAL